MSWCEFTHVPRTCASSPALARQRLKGATVTSWSLWRRHLWELTSGCTGGNKVTMCVKPIWNACTACVYLPVHLNKVDRCEFRLRFDMCAAWTHVYPKHGSIWLYLKYLQGWAKWKNALGQVLTQVAIYHHKQYHKHTSAQSKVLWVWKSRNPHPTVRWNTVGGGANAKPSMNTNALNLADPV